MKRGIQKLFKKKTKFYDEFFIHFRPFPFKCCIFYFSFLQTIFKNAFITFIFPEERHTQKNKLVYW